MMFPPPRRSRFNTLIPESQIDYSMVAPLLSDGSQLSCKRYSRTGIVASFSAGQTITVQMSGSVFHSGGHCQFSVSYDEKTFVVIKTYMKDCFVGTGLSFSMQLPSTTPPCTKCIFAWSWVNAIGNREFYMNCADITISNWNSGSKYLIGRNYTIANMPNYPTIPEFPQSTYDGSDIYASAPIVTVYGGGNIPATTATTTKKKTKPGTTIKTTTSTETVTPCISTSVFIRTRVRIVYKTVTV